MVGVLGDEGTLLESHFLLEYATTVESIR